jgi:zinc protease
MTRIFCLLLLLLAAAPLQATLPFPQDGSDLKLDPAARFGTLSNGVRYVVLHNAEPKGRASVRFGVLTGSFNETEDQRGLAHFIEHLAFNGSTHFPAGTLVEYFQRLGMSFGGDTNAHTSFDETVYYLELPDTKPETVENAFMLFADYGGGLLLQPESIDKERGIILSEERARDSVNLRAWKAEIGFILPESIIKDRLPIGIEEVITAAQRGRFLDYYDTWYRPENFVVVAVGDFNVAVVEAELVKVLSALHARSPARIAANLGVVKPVVGVVAKLHTDMDAPAVTVTIKTVSSYAYEADTAERRLRLLPRDLALSMLNRRLSVLAKTEGAPFSGGVAEADEQFDFFQVASIELTCKPAQWRAALGAAEQELRRALTHGFDPTELRETVASARNELEQAVKSATTRHSRELADALTSALIERTVFTSPEDNLALFAPALEKVTVEDCVRALRAAWEAPGCHLFVSGNLRMPDNPIAAITAAYTASSGVPVAAPEILSETQFAYTDFGPQGNVAVRRDMHDLGATLLEFQNGVRLNLKATNLEAGRIRVSVRIGGGRLVEPINRPGLAQAAMGTFAAGGLGKHSADDLQRIFAGKTVSFSFAADEDAFALAGTTNQQDLALQLQLLCAYLTDPGYRPEAMRQFHKGLEQTYVRLAHTVEGPLTTQVPVLMANGDPRFGLPSQDVMFGRTNEEVQTWLGPQLANGSVEIAIVGDFDPDTTVATVARTFGALALRTPKPDYTNERKVKMPAGPVKRDYMVPTDIERGIVQLMWPATDRREVHRARRLQLLGLVFQDRLRLKLREQMGGTYNPIVWASLSDTFIGYGFIVAQATVTRVRAQEVADAIKAVAASLASDGVTEEELQRAKQPLLTGLRTSERQNRYWLESVLSAAQEQPQRLDWARDRYADNEAITKPDLDALARQYLPSDRASQFISLPETNSK